MPSRLLPLLLLLAALPAWATSMFKLDVPGLTQASDLVVRGTVVRQEARWTEDKRRIVTETEVEVLEVLKGSPGATAIKVVQPGGEVGEVGQHVSGTAQFRDAEHVVLFLEQRGPGRFVLTGMSQGKFRVERGADGTQMAVPELPGEALLLDPVTHVPVPAGERKSVPLPQLKETVRTHTNAPVPGRTP